MTVRLSTAARTAAADAIVDLVDAGSGAGKLRIYSGSQPANPATSPTGTLLLEFTLNDPAFDAAASGSAALDVSPELTTTGLAAGTAGWGRLVTSTEAAGTGLGVVDFAAADITMSTTTISVGLDVDVTSLTLTQPA